MRCTRFHGSHGPYIIGISLLLGQKNGTQYWSAHHQLARTRCTSPGVDGTDGLHLYHTAVVMCHAMEFTEDPGCLRLCFRLPKDQIKYVKWIVEAHDGLAVVSSPRGRGEMEWMVPVGLEAEAKELAGALAAEVGLVFLEG